MNGLKFLLFLLIVTAPAHAERRSAGIFFRWGVFTENPPPKCFAVARPVAVGGGGDANPYVSISFGPGRAGEVHARLRRPPLPGSSVLLKVAGRSFPMTSQGDDAWLADPRANRIVTALLRTGTALTIESRSVGGTRIMDSYALKGAASAIDAAAAACARH